ncbi:MAG TPA: cytochrome c oxidase assembly factor CtaG [Pseudogracilibacillus sp.]|nr:cytochrome c oxidase assembly factor CtaG [Pseudogracilibacillus sp.]
MWLELQIFGFRALWSPYFLAFVILVSLLYYLLTGPYRHVFGDVKKASINEQLLFYSGMLVIYIAQGSPVDLLAHIMMSAHMTQMALFYLLFPILIIRGLPNWLWEKIINIKGLKTFFKIFAYPLIALLLFNSLFALYHIPAVFDFSKSSQLIHESIKIFLLIASFFMWWPVVTPLKQKNPLNPLLKMAYLLGSTVIISIACALLIFSSNPMYQVYASEGPWIQALSLCVPGDVLDGLAGTLTGADMFSPFSGVEDQQLGGIIMMLVQQIIYGFVIAWIFFTWFSKKSLENDPLPTEDERFDKGLAKSEVH